MLSFPRDKGWAARLDPQLGLRGMFHAQSFDNSETLDILVQ